MTRRPRSVYGTGSEPDARFSLANERTALAWLRTSLGVVAAGVGLAVLETSDASWSALRLPAAAVCAAGAVLAVAAVVRWMRVEQAVRRGDPIPAPSALFVLAAVVALVGAVLAAFVITTRL